MHASQPRLHLEFIDGIRALAALFVMICHAWFQPSNGYYESRLMNRLGLSYGPLAVDVFLVVSGFCLMLPILQNGGSMRSVRTFFMRRARRILPPYYAALLLSCAFILLVASEPTGTVWDNSLPLTWQRFLANALLVHDFPLGLEGGAINYPFWSIAVEWHIYFVMPLIVIAFRRFGGAITVAAAVAVGMTLHIALGGWLDTARPWYLGLFTMGCAAAIYGQKVRREALAYFRLLCLLTWVFAVMLIVFNGRIFFGTYIAYIDTLIGIATALTLMLMIREVYDGKLSLLTRMVSCAPLVRVGAFSYSLYLVHAPLLHALDRIFTALISPRPEVMFVLLVAASPLIVAAAYLFYLAFERPFAVRSVTRQTAYPRFALPWARLSRLG